MFKTSYDIIAFSFIIIIEVKRNLLYEFYDNVIGEKKFSERYT